MSDTKTHYTKKFSAQLGTVNDFVLYVRNVERTGNLQQLSSFRGTNNTWGGKRYLLIKRGGAVDFRHFFAAMMQRLEGTRTGRISIGSTTEGTTLLLGVTNEVAQCIDESSKGKLNSCFAREDLISNRLGARFGEIVVIRRAEASTKTVAAMLNTFLHSLQPMPPSAVSKMKMQSNTEVFLEAVGAVLKSLADALVPSAY